MNIPAPRDGENPQYQAAKNVLYVPKHMARLKARLEKLGYTVLPIDTDKPE